MLFLSDNQGNMLACSPVMAGNHNDLYEIEHTFNQLCQTLENAGICLKGLFVNADAGFDSQAFREQCEQKEIILNVCENKRNNAEKVNHHYIFDELLYEERYVIEQANAWIDAFKTLLIRFETKAKHWLDRTADAVALFSLLSEIPYQNWKSLNKFNIESENSRAQVT